MACPYSNFSDTDGQIQNPDGDSVFSKSLYLNFNDDKVKFDNRNLDNPNDNYGSVSGFFPKLFHSYECPHYMRAFSIVLW